MPNIISKIFAVILAVVAMFYIPAYQIYKQEENFTYVNTYEAVTDFVDNVRMKGYITPKMYEDFQQKIHVGDVLFEVEMLHQHKIYSPVYTDPQDTTSFTGEYQVHYDEFYGKQIKDVLYGDSSTPMDERQYKLENGDFFQIYVENKTKFKSTMLFDFLTGGLGSDPVVISIPYGGMVLNEDWSKDK
jgi:hypothetical protein